MIPSTQRLALIPRVLTKIVKKALKVAVHG